ncbi:MAG TPA: formate hydrogenlyase [Candidatus Competibacteraceae bacterium]|nr:formate hydrogenlyase [Candidatus Competibacteraceae bacterium]
MDLARLSLQEQAIVALAALILFTSFALLAQSRLLAIVKTFAWQGALVALTTALVGYATRSPHLYVSALITLALKALFVPWLLYRLIHRFKLLREQETLVHSGTVLLLGTALVIFSYHVALPIEQLAQSSTRPVIAVSLAQVLLGMLMLITRGKAVSQVVGFMAIENGLFFAAVAATHGMPMIVELGAAFDVLVAAVIFGVFFFHIRDSIDSLDVDQLHRLSETE